MSAEFRGALKAAVEQESWKCWHNTSNGGLGGPWLSSSVAEGTPGEIAMTQQDRAVDPPAEWMKYQPPFAEPEDDARR